MMSEIYIELLDEGTPTWRPTKAVDRGNGVYLVLPTDDYDEDDEKWAFPPGSFVACERVIDGAEETLVARRLVSEK